MKNNPNITCEMMYSDCCHTRPVKRVYDSLCKCYLLIVVEKHQKIHYWERNKTKILKNRKKKSVCS